MHHDTCVLFGGSGFIGLHLARFLLDNGMAGHVWLADIAPPRPERFPAAIHAMLASGRARHVPVDVRRPIAARALPDRASLAVNLAAVHREPGHRPFEYFETNLQGADNVCAWCEQTGCNTLVFTSSIVCYGPGEAPRDERAVPAPASPYGASKLAAEKIHQGWQRGGNRRLLIVRPGVIFGPGEGGNVTRLVRAVIGGYFAYMGNRGTRKAGGYVRELCHAIAWGLEQLEQPHERALLFNFTMDPPATLEQYVDAIQAISGVRRPVPSLPYGALLAASYGIELLSRPLGIEQPIDVARVRKLVRSNNIEPAVLRQRGYGYAYTLEQAMADWRSERPHDWQPRLLGRRAQRDP